MFDLKDIKPSYIMGAFLAAIKYHNSDNSTPKKALMDDVTNLKSFTMLDEFFAHPEMFIQEGTDTLDYVNLIGMVYSAVKDYVKDDAEIESTVDGWLQNKNKDELIEILLSVDLTSPDFGGATIGAELLDSLPPVMRSAVSLMTKGINKWGRRDDEALTIAGESVTPLTRSLNNITKGDN